MIPDERAHRAQVFRPAQRAILRHALLIPGKIVIGRQRWQRPPGPIENPRHPLAIREPSGNREFAFDRRCAKVRIGRDPPMAGSGRRGDAARSTVALVRQYDRRAFARRSDGRPGPRNSAADDQHIALETLAGFDGGHVFYLRATGCASHEATRFESARNNSIEFMYRVESVPLKSGGGSLHCPTAGDAARSLPLPLVPPSTTRYSRRLLVSAQRLHDRRKLTLDLSE